MSTILLTGSAGGIGRVLRGALGADGHDVRGFDIVGPTEPGDDDRVADLRDLDAVRDAMRDIDVVVHAGAIPNDRFEDHLTFETNVQGTWNVLQAAAEAGIKRVVCFSSVNAQGSVRTHRQLEQLPIDDDYPHHPVSPYQLSKHLVEEMCRSFTEQHDMITLCLRPVWVTYPETYAQEPFGTKAFEEQWRSVHCAYVDVRDVADAVMRCLHVEGVPHDAILLAARDTLAAAKTRELVARWHPNVAWPREDMEAWLAPDPYRTLFDCRHARDVLGWEPRHSWRDGTATDPDGAG